MADRTDLLETAACQDSSVDPVVPPHTPDTGITHDDQQSDVTQPMQDVTQAQELPGDTTADEEQLGDVWPSAPQEERPEPTREQPETWQVAEPTIEQPETRQVAEPTIEQPETRQVAEQTSATDKNDDNDGFKLKQLAKTATAENADDSQVTLTASGVSSTSAPQCTQDLQCTQDFQSTKDLQESATSSLDPRQEQVTIMAAAEAHVQASSDEQQQQAAQPASSVPPPQPAEKAVCKYRWGKVVPTSSQRIIFFCSAHPKEPVFLHWSPHNEAYFSEELHVPCGDYAGHVIVEGKTYPVEAFSVRSYTFEVDLFLKEDVIEDEVATNSVVVQELKFQQQQQQGPVDTYRDISSSALRVTPASRMEDNAGVDENGIRHNSKYENLLRQQLQHKDSLDGSLDGELVTSQKSDHLSNGSGSKRLTPVGDIDKETFQDGCSSFPIGSSGDFEASRAGNSSEKHTPQHLYLGSTFQSRQDLETERRLVKSAEFSSGHLSANEVSFGNNSTSKSPVRSEDDYTGGTGSGHLTLQRELYDASTGAYSGSGSLIPADRRVDDVLGSSSSYSSSVRQTLTRETIGDVLGKEAILSNAAQSHALDSIRQTPDKEISAAGSSYSPARSTPQREIISEGLHRNLERQYGGQEVMSSAETKPVLGRPVSQSDSRSGSQQGSQQDGRPGSLAGSQQGSRAQSLNSLTSEQELSQFLDHNISGLGGESRHTPLNFNTHPDESASLPPIMRDRPSSLPAYSTQSVTAVEKRAYTPSSQNWSSVPAKGIGEAMFQQDSSGRIMPKSSVSSRASSRTVTPVSAGGDREDSVKVRDLEETVATLRKLLSSREQEVHELTAQLRDLKDINQSLRKDLDHARARRTPTGPDDQERQYQQLLQEKEILAAEVVKLRDRLETTRSSSGNSFSSNSAASQQRRIDELEAHVCDLRRSNESISQKLMKAERHIKDLTQDNQKGMRYNDRRLQIEIQQLKEDVRTLHDRNYALQDENFKLKEGRELLKTSEFRSGDVLAVRSPLTSSLRSDDGGLQRTTTLLTSVHDESNHQIAEHGHPKHLPPSDQLNSPGRRLDRSYGSDSFPVMSSRDMTQKSLDRSFGSDHGTRDCFRETSSYSRLGLENGDKDLTIDRLPKYRDFGADLRRTESGRYDLLRSRPDGEVSEKLRSMDAGKYRPLSAEKLRSLDRERKVGPSKVTMSAERIRILEEAERNRERRALEAANSTGYRAGSVDTPLCSKDDTRQRKSEANLSDDSDSTAVLMSYDVKSNTYPAQREQRKSKHAERSRSKDMYYDHTYMQETDQGKQGEREFRDLHGGYRETNGDDSDTATDILLSAEPGRSTGQSQSVHRQQRSTNIGDDASISSMSDGDDPQDSLRRRSRSADGKDKKSLSRYSQKNTLRPSTSTEMLGGGKTVTLASGFRSVTPQPLTTQHNKNALLQQQPSLSSSFSQGLRPFAPRSPGDVRIDDMVKFSRQGGKLSQGTVKFVGHLPGRSDVYLGVELYKEEGKHDGTFESIRYFKCKPNKGVFVAFNKVVMAWAPN